MQRYLTNDGQTYERGNKRNASVRKMTRLMVGVLVILCVVAIGQDRRLAPPVHDGLVRISDLAMGYVSRSEKLSAALSEMQKSYAELTGDG